MPDFEGSKEQLVAEIDPSNGSGVDIISTESGESIGTAFFPFSNSVEEDDLMATIAIANARLWAGSNVLLKAAGDFIVTYRTEHGDPGRRDVRAAFDILQAAVTACLSATVETRESPTPPPEAEPLPA